MIVISTSANIPLNYTTRKEQYLKGLTSILTYFKINPYIIETYSKTDYLSEHFTGQSTHSNKGIDELININTFLGTLRISDDCNIIKTTLRYEIISDCFINTVMNNDKDCFVKLSKDIYGENDKGVHTFLFSMKYKCWKEFMESFFVINDDPIEWQIANFVNTKDTLYLDKLDIIAHINELNSTYII